MATGASQATKDVAEKAVEDHRRFLEEHIDPDTGLLDILLGNGTLENREVRQIKTCKTFDERNSELLKCILEKHECDRLFTALRETEQLHIVNYLNENGEYKSEIGGEWPLTKKEVSILNTNQRSLVDLLECDELLGHLFSSKVINKRQVASISSEPNPYKKNEALLECLQRRSLRDYYQTIKCLHQTKQSHIAEILAEGGVVVRVHADLDGENVTEAENKISTAIANMIINDRSSDQANRILELVNLKVIAAKRGQSIVLYIYCKTTEELEQLLESLTLGDLKDSVELLFNYLLAYSQKAAVTAVTISTEEFQKMQMYFKDSIKVRAIADFNPKQMGVKEKRELRKALELRRGRRETSEDVNPYSNALKFKKGDKMKTIPPANIGDSTGWWGARNLDSLEMGFIPRNRVVIDFTEENQPVKTTMHMLPLEPLDIILQKSCLCYALSGKQSTDKRDEFLVNRLLSVDFCWFQRLAKPRFKKTIWRHLSNFYGALHRRIAIFMSNRLYLEENIQPKALISRLRSADCLTDVETRLLNRQTIIQNTKKLFRKNNNPDLLHVMRSFDDTKLSDFINYLQKSNEKLITRVARIGGVLLKAIILNQDTTKRQLMDRRINELRSETEPRSYQMEKLIRQLKDDNIEILNSLLDRQTVVWIWCQSQTGLEKIQMLNESNSLIDVFTGLTTPPSSSVEITEPMAVSICRDQFEKCVGKLRFNLDPVLVHTIRIKAAEVENKSISGMTILDEELFVVGVMSSEVEVYDSMKLSFSRRWNLKDLSIPYDIGSCNRNKCLYILDLKGSYGRSSEILRVDPNGILIKSWSTGDDWGRSLSVTDESNIILTVFDKNKLNEFSSNGQLIREMHLSSDKGFRRSVRSYPDILHPWHAIKLTSGHVVVSHGVYDDDLHRVCTVDADGELKKSFGGKPGPTTGQLNRPVYLAVDGNRFVMVVDSENSRVFLLGSNLEFKREILSEEKHGLRLPSRILLDQTNNRLLVADTELDSENKIHKDGRILIFEFR